MAAEIIKLKTNIALIGTIGAVYYSKSDDPQYGDQITAYGDWNVGKGRVYLPAWCAEKLQELGIITGGPNKEDRYDVKQGLTVTILRTEDGKKKPTSITLGGDGTTPQPTPVAQGSPEKPQTERDQWSLLMKRYQACQLLAEKVLPESPVIEDLRAVTATFFIEANKLGLAPPEPKDD